MTGNCHWLMKLGSLLRACGVVVLLGLVPYVARASSCAGYDSAMALCQADGQAKSAQFSSWNCSLGTGTLANSVVLNYVGVNGHVGSMGPYGSPINCPGFDPTADQCKARPPLHQAFDGVNKTVVNAGCTYALKSDDDGSVKVCGVWNGKQFCTGTATWEPTGAYSGTPAANPDPPPPAPKACGGGSCFDTNNNQYCAVASAGQVCVPAPNGNPGAGGCVSNGGTTLCAGSPAPIPPNPPIVDPSSQIASSDKYSAQTGNGVISLVTVNNYNAVGNGAQNGAGSGDVGAPASSTSTGLPQGDGTTSSGGGDCNTPPIVQGSGGMSAIAYQTWRTRCELEGQEGGTGPSVGTLYTKSNDTAQSVVASFQASVQNAPIAGAVTGFFSVGNVSGACPTWTLAATDWNPQMTFDFYCRPEASDMLDMARIVLLIACAYVAFVIAMGDS